jgi:cation/acetate symporter
MATQTQDPKPAMIPTNLLLAMLALVLASVILTGYSALTGRDQVGVPKPAEILALVSASFSLAASAFFPGMVLGMVWPKVHRHAVVAGMLAGLGVTVFYIAVNAPGVRHMAGLVPNGGLWMGIQPVSAGVFGVPVGFMVMVLLTGVLPAPKEIPAAHAGSPSRIPQADYPGL